MRPQEHTEDRKGAFSYRQYILMLRILRPCPFLKLASASPSPTGSQHQNWRNLKRLCGWCWHRGCAGYHDCEKSYLLAFWPRSCGNTISRLKGHRALFFVNVLWMPALCLRRGGLFTSLHSKISFLGSAALFSLYHYPTLVDSLGLVQVLF